MWRVGVVVGVLSAVLVTACAGGASKPSLEASSPGSTSAALNGTVVIGDTTFEFAMTCYAPGAGSVVAVGKGTEPGTGRSTRVLVQAFFGDPYVGVTVGDNEIVYEPSLDEPIDLVYQDDVVRGGAIQFVKNLDLQSRLGDVAGLGAVTVTCNNYRSGLPAGYGK